MEPLVASIEFRSLFKALQSITTLFDLGKRLNCDSVMSPLKSAKILPQFPLELEMPS